MIDIKLELLSVPTLQAMHDDLTSKYDSYTYDMTEDEKDSDKYVDELRRAFGEIWLHAINERGYDVDDRRYRN